MPATGIRHAVALLVAAAVVAPADAGADEPLVLGLSHVPTAVRDLEATRARYERFGFSLKPGRPHDNGIRNLHIKFRDGTEVEFLTASQARDELTAEYVEFLRRGDGPAFLALYAPSKRRLVRALRAAGMDAREGRHGVSFPSDHPLEHIFFGSLSHSSTDRPGHFAHRNTAESLIAVWLAADDQSPYEDLFARLGVKRRGDLLRLRPVKARARRIGVGKGEILLLPGHARRVPGRPLVGMTLRVRDIDVAGRVLRRAGHDLRAIDLGREGRSIFLPPDVAGGFWLELREIPRR
jgi:catechol 2,3-dioxygenase-like lactoylglutathione lyase family enzyme